MDSLVRAIVILSLILWLIGPFSIFLASRDHVPFFVVLIVCLFAICYGTWWVSIPTGARWIGLFPISCGLYALYRHFNL